MRLWIRGRHATCAPRGAGCDPREKGGRAPTRDARPTPHPPAEPITFGHLAAAHAWALVRDRDRLADARRRVDVLPLGSGALAGTALPLDREALARDLGFAAVSENALDAVMDRDFAAEFVFACAQAQTHLARLAEDDMAPGHEYGFFRAAEASPRGPA